MICPGLAWSWTDSPVSNILVEDVAVGMLNVFTRDIARADICRQSFDNTVFGDYSNNTCVRLASLLNGIHFSSYLKFARAGRFTRIKLNKL